MAKEKRQRQKEGRLLRLEEQRAQDKRDQRMRQIRAIVLVVVAILGVALLISLLGGDDGDSTSTTTTTEAPEAEEPEAPEEASPEEFSDPEIAEEVLARGAPDPDGAPEDLASDALEVETLIEGDGRQIEAGDLVTVHYYGVLSDGARFDDSWSRGQPFQTTIPGQVIDGWNEGLLGASVGDRLRLDIGSDLAYGDAGSGQIPPGAPLTFVIDVIDAQPAGGATGAGDDGDEGAGEG